MKLYIIGSVGSGKTTLGRILASKLDIPHIQTDNLVWERKKPGDLRRSYFQRNRLMERAISQKNWLIEGVHIDWTDPIFKAADLIIILDIPYLTRTKRITTRHFKQLLGLEKANYKTEWGMLKKMYRWNRYFEREMKPVLFEKLKTFKLEARSIKNQKELEILLLEIDNMSK